MIKYGQATRNIRLLECSDVTDKTDKIIRPETDQYQASDRSKPLTPHELADFYSVSINTVYFWVSRAAFPRIKVGKHLRFDLNKVQQYFDEQSELEVPSCQGPAFSVKQSRPNRSLKTRINASRSDPSKKGIRNGNY